MGANLLKYYFGEIMPMKNVFENYSQIEIFFDVVVLLNLGSLKFFVLECGRVEFPEEEVLLDFLLEGD